MTLDIAQFVTQDGHSMQFSQQQASDFAKGVAGDFNPIHDVGAKRFCVPGDLLFAALLNRYGVYTQLHVDLMALVNADVLVKLPAELVAINEILDEGKRHLLTINVSGDTTTESGFVSSLVEQYVKFSGKTFPDILVELMRDNQVMINPGRPLVIYKDMSLKLTSIKGENISLALDEATLNVEGKKGKASLRFVIKDNDQIIGHGEKNMLLSGLRQFDEQAMTDIVAQYTQWKQDYQTT